LLVVETKERSPNQDGAQTFRLSAKAANAAPRPELNTMETGFALRCI